MRKILIAAIIVLVVFCGCAKPAPHFTNHAFYYWKTIFKISADERAMFDSLRVNKLYLRLYDVVYDDVKKQPVPVSPVSFGAPHIDGMEIVPVVFIRQDVMKNISDKEAKALAANMAGLAGSILERNRIQAGEFQLDYDWTPSTRERYFNFIESFRKELQSVCPGAVLSATVRLHQVKYKKATGVPPVSKGMLMAYNMKEIRDLTKEDTVFDVEELAKYAQSINSYPLKLDLALPVFPSCFIYDNGQIKTILTGLDKALLNDTAKFKRTGEGFYVAKGCFRHKGTEFSVGDTVKLENVNINDIKKAVQLLNRGKSTGDTLCLFHFDTGLIEEATGEKVISLGSVFNN
ncbi:MAG: hypothetical protein LLG37_05270 [Spirochaetia bacterium]|nr:hypothetical protein [Spirochaetia bacterium]